MATEKTLESANKFYDSELINDVRVFSANPKDWDAIKDLDMTYVGYFDLPDVYLKLRDILPSKTENLFFIDGMFIPVKAGEMPSDVYLRYEKRTIKDPIYKLWWKNKEQASLYKLHRKDWVPQIQLPNTENAITKAIEQITPIFLTKLQPRTLAKKRISKQDLYAAYKEAICNSAEIEKYVSFETFVSDINFAIGTANWSYAPRIANLVKNEHLTKVLKNRLRKKIKQNKIKQSAKWYRDYKKYQYKTKLAKRHDVYTLTLKNFFQDIDSMRSINDTEKFTVLKKDLFNPMSQYYINNLISAALNKDFASQHLTIQESMNISTQKRIYRVLFGYKYNKHKKNWAFANNQKIQKNASIYSMEDLGFGNIAKWHKQLRRQTIKATEKSR